MSSRQMHHNTTHSTSAVQLVLHRITLLLLLLHPLVENTTFDIGEDMGLQRRSLGAEWTTGCLGVPCEGKLKDPPSPVWGTVDSQLYVPTGYMSLIGFHYRVKFTGYNYVPKSACRLR